MKKLELALGIEAIADNALSVFLYLAQKGDSISSGVVEKLLDKIQTRTDIMAKLDCLSSLWSLIQTKPDIIKTYKDRIEEILGAELKNKNTNTQKVCINMWMVFMESHQVSTEVMNGLLNVCLEVDCDESVREAVFSLFKSIGCKQAAFTPDFRARVELADLKCDSSQQLLSKLEAYKPDLLLERNYAQLKSILDQEESDELLKLKALKLLNKNKTRLKVEYFESVKLLKVSTNVDEIKNACSEILFGLDQFEQSTKLALEFTLLSEELSKTCHIDPLKVQELIGILRKKIKNSSQIISLEDLLNSCHEIDQLFFEDSSFVFIVERILLADLHKKKALLAYIRIAKEKLSANVENVLEHVIVAFLKDPQGGDTDILRLILECMRRSVCDFARPSENFIKILETSLHDDDEKIRSLTFECFMLAFVHRKFESELFLDWCGLVQVDLSEKTGKEIQFDSDLFKVIFSLKSIDLDVFKSKEESFWSRELLVSDLFEQFKPLHFDRMEFFASWLQFEENFKTDSINILFMIHKQRSNFSSLVQISETLTFLNNFRYDEIIDKLDVDEELFKFERLKVAWCERLILEKLKNKNIDTNYLHGLAEGMIGQLSTSLLRKLFEKLGSIDNLKMLEKLIDFCKNENSLNQLELHINMYKIIKLSSICKSLDTLSNDLKETFLRLLEKKWTFEQIEQVIKAGKSSNKSQECIKSVFRIIDQYRINPSSFNECIISVQANDTIQLMNNLAVSCNFQFKIQDKNSTELLEELKSLNKDDHDLTEYIANRISGDLARIKCKAFKSSSNDSPLPICEWSKENITNWSDFVKQKKDDLDYVEALAVVRHANLKVSKKNLTDAQIISSLVCLHTENKEKKGKLLQIATGEGKSTIVCILAIINALKGQNVDIITSSSVLAERDAKEKQALFHIFNLTCSHNNDSSIYIKGAKECYRSTIVYGEISQFQFDYLRDKYSLLGTLADRESKIAIIDEVDSMLIDDNSKISRLSATAVGMDHFHPVYCFIWYKLLSIKDKFIMINNEMYWLNAKIDFAQGKMSLEFADEQGDLNQIVDLELFIKNNGDISRFGKLIKGDLDSFLIETLNAYIDDLIQDNVIKKPKNFEQFFDKQRKKWVLNAIEAMSFQENIQYIVQDGQIKPVDYFSTGLVQNSTNWSDGLHQFLQIKHNLKLTCETLTTNFLSNVGFINSYQKMFGMSGTLGSAHARNTLKNVYNVELVNIPQQHKKQYLEYPTLMAQSESEWMHEIISAALVETKKERGVLIICQSIDQANAIAARLKSKYRSTAIKLYTMNNMNQERHVEKVLPGEIVIATNLAGRGTDIQTNEIEKFGGLHVILVFMPNNQRVEEQAFGRTARRGKRGTGQMILNTKLTEFHSKQIKEERDAIESNMLTDFQKNDLKLIMVKDELFKKFCLFLNDEIRQDIRNKSGVWAYIKSKFTLQTPTLYEYNILSAIEEQWAMFLNKLEDKSIPLESSGSEFDKFIHDTRQNYATNRVVQNQYYNTIYGNDLIVNESKHRDALIYFKTAIEHDQNFNGAAHVGVAWCSVLSKEKNKAAINQSLRKGLNIFATEMSLLNTMQTFLQKSQHQYINSDLDKQLNVKCTILGSYLNSIQNCVDTINRSLRLIDIEMTRETGEEHFFGLERRQDDSIEFNWNKNADYSVTFNSLSTREDLCTTDQAIETVNSAYLKTLGSVKGWITKLVNNEYSHVGLKLNQISLSKLKALLNVDKEFQELDKEAALSQLNKEKSFFSNKFASFRHFSIGLNENLEKIELSPYEEKIEKVIEKIEKSQDPDLRFDIVIKNVNCNEINEFFTKKTNSSHFQIGFVGLNHDFSLELLKQFESNNACLEITLNKKNLLEILKNENITSGLIRFNPDNDSEKMHKVYEKFNKDSLMEKLEKLEDKLICFKMDIVSSTLESVIIT